MNVGDENTRNASQSPATPHRSWRAVWLVGLLVLATVTVLAFGAYRQPELLLNLIGLRYCG